MAIPNDRCCSVPEQRLIRWTSIAQYCGFEACRKIRYGSITRTDEDLLFRQQCTDHEPPKQLIPRSLSFDQKGHLYCGTYGQIGQWEKKNNNERTFQTIHDTSWSQVLNNEEIWHILSHPSGTYFQSFSVLLKYNNDRLTQIIPPGNIMFLSQINDQIIVPVIGKGLYYLDAQDAFELIPGSETFADKTDSGILPLGNSFLVGTQEAGVFQYKNGRFTIWSNPLNDLLSEKQLNKALLLSGEKLAFGTILDGLIITDLQGNIIHHINQQNGLLNNTVLSLFEDQDHHLWIGLDKGISLLALGEPLLYYQDLQSC